MSVFERSVEAPFVALFALWIFVVMPVVLSATFYLTRKLSRVCTNYKLGLIAPYIMGMTIPLHCIAFVLFLAHFSVRAIAFAMCTYLWHMFRFVRLYLGETGTYIFDLIFFVPIFYLLNACGAFEISGADSVLMMVGVETGPIPHSSKVVDRSEARSWTRGAMAMLVSILGLWANKNTFINRKFPTKSVTRRFVGRTSNDGG